MILNLQSFDKIYLYKEYVDMRKQISGLSGLVQSVLKLNAFEKNLFIFVGKKKNVVKILYWDRNGFCLWQKKLESQKFSFTREREGDSTQNILEFSEREFLLWLEGYDIFKMKPHAILNFKYVS